MARKKPHEEHANHERWLISYADFITLLFAFFVVLFSASQVDRSKTKKMALAIESAFDRFSIFKFQSGDEIEGGRQGSGGNAKRYREFLMESVDGAPIILAPEIITEQGVEAPTKYQDDSMSENTGFLSSYEKALSKAHRKLLTLINQKKLSANIDMRLEDRGVVISIRDAILFKSGADELVDRSKSMLEGIGKILESLPNYVRVEGHTDSDTQSGAFKSNWELSTARASYIVKYIIDHFEVDPTLYSAVGYGPYRPIADNNTEAGRIRNRRVDIVILSEKASQTEALYRQRDNAVLPYSKQQEIIRQQSPMNRLNVKKRIIEDKEIK